MDKTVIFAFQGEPVCFAHAMLNILDMADNGIECLLIIEGSATALITPLNEESHPQHKMYREILSRGLLKGVCRACCHKMGTLDAAGEQGLTLLDDMSGHPSMAPYLKEGYRIITL